MESLSGAQQTPTNEMVLSARTKAQVIATQENVALKTLNANSYGVIQLRSLMMYASNSTIIEVIIMGTVGGVQGQTTSASRPSRRYTTVVDQRPIRCADCYIVSMIER